MSGILPSTDIAIDRAGRIYVAYAGKKVSLCPGIPCSFCTDCTPSYMTVVTSGISMCTNCFGGFSKFSIIAGSINGAFKVVQTSACEWQAQIATMREEIYPLPGCIGTPTIDDIPVMLIVTKTATFWYIQIYPVKYPSPGLTAVWGVFASSNSYAYCDPQGLVFNSWITACIQSTFVKTFAMGGTATLTSCCKTCDLCKSATPNAVVTQSAGPCGAICCDGIAGTYLFQNYSSGPLGCTWSLTYSSGNCSWELVLTYTTATGVWYAGIDQINPSCGCTYQTGPVYAKNGVSISCVGGKLVGSFVLNGLNGGPENCQGCTASITLT